MRGRKKEVSTWRFREQIARSKKTPALQAIVASAPKPWNSLPFKIRMATSVDHFKKRLKTYFLARLFLGKISAF